MTCDHGELLSSVIVAMVHGIGSIPLVGVKARLCLPGGGAFVLAAPDSNLPGMYPTTLMHPQALNTWQSH